MATHAYTLYYAGTGAASLSVSIPETDTCLPFSDSIPVTVEAAAPTTTDTVEATITRNVLISTEALGDDTTPRPTPNMMELNTALLLSGRAFEVHLHSRSAAGTTAATVDTDFFPNYQVNGGNTINQPLLTGSTTAGTVTATERPVFEQPTVLNTASTDKRILRVEKDADNYFELQTGILPASNTVTFGRSPATNAHGGQWSKGKFQNGKAKARVWGTVIALQGTMTNGDTVTITRILRSTS